MARLDRSVLPRMAGALRRVGRAGRRMAAATGRPGRALSHAARRNVTITTAVVAVALAAGLIVATGGDRHHSVAPAPPNPQTVLPGGQLGPAAGQQASAYIAMAQQREAQLDVSRSSEVTAVVDLNGYLTSAAVSSVLSQLPGVTLSRAFARAAPPAAGGVHTVTATVADLGAQLAQIRHSAHLLVLEYQRRVAIAQQAPTPHNERIVRQYAAIARQARADAAGIGPTADCVFALVVTGPPHELRRLAGRADVRVLDPAPQGVATQDLMIVPLEPQTVGAVAPLQFAAD